MSELVEFSTLQKLKEDYAIAEYGFCAKCGDCVPVLNAQDPYGEFLGYPEHDDWVDKCIYCYVDGIKRILNDVEHLMAKKMPQSDRLEILTGLRQD